MEHEGRIDKGGGFGDSVYAPAQMGMGVRVHGGMTALWEKRVTDHGLVPRERNGNEHSVYGSATETRPQTRVGGEC